jgi:hypothetical protein
VCASIFHNDDSDSHPNMAQVGESAHSKSLLNAHFRLPFESRKSVGPPHQQISRLAFQCVTKLIQNVSAVTLAASVKERVESGVGDARPLLKFVARPALTPEHSLQFADYHVCTLV